MHGITYTYTHNTIFFSVKRITKNLKARLHKKIYFHGSKIFLFTTNGGHNYYVCKKFHFEWKLNLKSWTILIKNNHLVFCYTQNTIRCFNKVWVKLVKVIFIETMTNNLIWLKISTEIYIQANENKCINCLKLKIFQTFSNY